MIWASWGLKDKLMGHPDLWLCHQCGDCSTYCPRGVNPADVLAALRYMNQDEYASPRFMVKLLSKPIFLPVVVAIPTLIIGLILLFSGTLHIPEGPVDYSLFFPQKK